MALVLGSSREQVKVSSGLDMLAGLWLFASVFMFRTDDGAAWDLAVIGGMVTVLAASRSLGGYSPSWPSWVNSILGLWVLISPWIVGRTTDRDLMWNSVITGFVIIVLAVWSAIATEPNENAH